MKNSTDIIELSIKAQVVGIDEAQFFKNDIVGVCNKLANRGKRVIVSGLDMDFNGEPFGAMPHILSIAEKVTKLHAICSDCGEIANNSFRTYKSNNLVLSEGNQQDVKWENISIDNRLFENNE